MKKHFQRQSSAIVFVFIFYVLVIGCSNVGKESVSDTAYANKLEQVAMDTLRRHNLVQFADSAFFYYYIYFGNSIIKGCATSDVKALIPVVKKRRLIYNNAVLTRSQISSDKSMLFISVVPLINDTILSCNMVVGESLPTFIAFDLRRNSFSHFIYSENSTMKLVDPDLRADYNRGIAMTAQRENEKPHRRFLKLIEDSKN